MKIVFIFMAVIAGALLPVQAALNAKMGKAIGDPIYASLISFVVGTLALFIVVLASKTPFSAIQQSVNVNWTVWLAGIGGAIYVSSVVILSPRLGAALTFALVVAGQLCLAVVLDHFGWLNIPVQSFNWQRLGGILLIISGVVLIRKF